MSLYSLSGKRVWVAGHRGMVGAAVVRALQARGDVGVVKAGREVVDLMDQVAVRNWMARERPDAIILAAAKVGGILANATYPADYLYNNLMIEANIIEAAFREKVGKLLFLGSTCIYPKFADQPINEDALLTGALEPTNEWYAIAKIAGIKLCQAYRKQHGCRTRHVRHKTRPATSSRDCCRKVNIIKRRHSRNLPPPSNSAGRLAICSRARRKAKILEPLAARTAASPTVSISTASRARSIQRRRRPSGLACAVGNAASWCAASTRPRAA